MRGRTRERERERMKERLTNHFNKQTERDTHEEGTIIKVHLYDIRPLNFNITFSFLFNYF